MLGGGLAQQLIHNRLEHDVVQRSRDAYYYGQLANLVYNPDYRDRARKVERHFTNGWIDPQFSDPRRFVMIHNSRCVTVQRGTQISSEDLLSDAMIVLGAEHLDRNVRRWVEEYPDIVAKYPHLEHYVTGHSLGGTVALHIHKRYPAAKTYAFNPGVARLDVDKAVDPNLEIWVVDGDPLSMAVQGNANVRVVSKKPHSKSAHSSEQFTFI